jgi:Na+/proline symporter
MMIGQTSAVDVERHLVRMRLTMALFLATVPAAIVLALVLPRRISAVASPLVVTVVAVVAILWVGFSANRDAAARLERIRRAFAVHGDEKRLLRDHWLVFSVVLFRLEVMIIGGLVVAVWGGGPALGVLLILLGGVMITLTWPTAPKTQLLLGRARVLRESVETDGV